MTDALPGRAVARDDRRTPAQWYCLLAGLSLLLAGVFGFISDSSFDTGDGEDVLGLIPINSADNLLHIALAALGIITGVISRDDDRGRGSTVLGRNSHDRFRRDTAATPRERTSR
jgi:hypothetical protein